MGCGVRASHLWNNSPFNSSNLTFYAKSLIVCSGTSQDISAANWPNGYYWDKSSNLSLLSTVSYTTRVSANGSGVGWLKIKDSSGATKATYDVWVGTPTISYIYGP